MTPAIDLDAARKVLTVVDAGLSNGLGVPSEGQMCIEAAVCFALGLPHSDNPECVAPALLRLVISLNDRGWSSKAARAKGMRRLALAQLGSRGTLDEPAFVQRLVEMTIRKVVPRALRAAASVHPDEKHRTALLAAADRCEQDGNQAAAAAAAAAAAEARDGALSFYAEEVVQILITMEAPGCQWLALTEAGQGVAS